MHESDFNSLKETLLHGGVAPKHVRRTIAELRDHHTDLFAEAFARGCSVENAEREASIRLGEHDALAAQILARPELRSWAHRWPWLVYCVTPTVVFIFVFAALLLLLGRSGAGHADYSSYASRWGSPESLWSLPGAIRLFSAVGLPLFLAGGCCFLAGRRRTAPRWPIVGVILASIIGAAFQLDVCWPHGANAHGALCLATNLFPPFVGITGTILRAVATSVATLGPYLWWRRRVMRALP